MENITSDKRKSFGAKGIVQKSPSGNAIIPNLSSARNVPKSPKENGTPNSKKSPFVVQSEIISKQRAQANKRKSLPATVKGSEEDIVSKKQKLGGALINIVTPKGKAQPVEKKYESAKKGTENDDKRSRAQRRRELVKHRRQSSKDKLANYVNKISSGDKDTIGEVKAKIEEIKKRGTLTATAKRKLNKLTRVLKDCGIDIPGQDSGKKQPKQKKHHQKTVDKKLQGNQMAKLQKKLEVAGGTAIVEEGTQSDDSEYNAETIVKPDKVAKNLNDDTEEDDDNESIKVEEDEEESNEDDKDLDEEESDDDGDGDNHAQQKVLSKKQQQASNKNQANTNILNKDKSRYVVFVGNLPYDVSQQEISDHFKTAGEVRDVRIPTDKNTKKPRGFAYVEVKNEQAYQKALSLHNTFIKGRKINVLYSQSGKKKGDETKKIIKAKNMKLQAMRKQGKLAGSVKESQKRAARRSKQNAKNN